MKKLLLIAFVTIGIAANANEIEKNIGSELLAVSTPTYTQVNKIRGGLFGYGSVKTTTDNNGNKITMCVNPGLKRCKSAADIVIGGTTWTEQECDALDRHIAGLITPEHTSGTILYNPDTVVTYTYNIDTNHLSYNMYSVQSATENGITW